MSDHLAICAATRIGLRWEKGNVFQGAMSIDDGSVLPIPSDELQGLLEAMQATAIQSNTDEFENFTWFCIKNQLLDFSALHVRPGGFVVMRHGPSTEKNIQKLYGKAIAAMKKGGWAKYQAEAIAKAVDLFKTLDTYGAAAFKCLNAYPATSKIAVEYVNTVADELPKEATTGTRGPRSWPAATRPPSGGSPEQPTKKEQYVMEAEETLKQDRIRQKMDALKSQKEQMKRAEQLDAARAAERAAERQVDVSQSPSPPNTDPEFPPRDKRKK
jgi:hypothetical protein